MAFLIDTIDSSGIFAQSANSATIATKDSNGNDITATYQPSGDYYSASNPSGFMTELPASATDVIDAVTANSGSWGGSALPISAGPGIKVNLVDNTLVFSNDETVLYSGAQTFSATLSESVKNFDKILIEYGPNNYNNISPALYYTEGFTDDSVYNGVHLEFVEHNGAAEYCFPKITTFVWHNNFTDLDAVGGLQYRVSGNAIQNELTGNQLYIRKIVGINRISGGN